MRKIIIPLCLIFGLLFASCSANNRQDTQPEPSRVLEAADEDTLAKADINSPEGLAQASSLIYVKLSDGRMKVDDAVYKLEEFCSEYSLKLLYKNRDQFRRGIVDFVDFMRNSDDRIIAVKFAKTVRTSDKEASIERVQEHKSGKKFYFRQDFVLENGQWRVYGDNITDAFRLGKK